MPQLTNVILKDGNNADVTFSPVDILNGISTLRGAGANPSIQPRLSVSCVPNGNKTAWNATAKIEVPVVQNIGGVDTVVDTEIVNVKFRLSPQGTSATRLTMSTLTETLVKSTLFRSMVQDLTNAY